MGQPEGEMPQTQVRSQCVKFLIQVYRQKIKKNKRKRGGERERRVGRGESTPLTAARNSPPHPHPIPRLSQESIKGPGLRSFKKRQASLLSRLSKATEHSNLRCKGESVLLGEN